MYIEWILIGSLIAVLLYLLYLKKKKKQCPSVVAFILIALLFGHFYSDGLRWQMMPAYVLVILFFYVIMSNQVKGHDIGRLPIRTIVISGIIVLIALGLKFVFPYNTMPLPSGDQEVGTISFDITDEDRVELYGDHVGENRKIRVQMWYPTDDIEGKKKEAWLSDGVEVAKGLPAFGGLPDFLLTYAARLMSNSYIEAPMSDAQETYPVVILSHGWSGFRNLHTDIGEMLASHGYIVVGIDHIYGSIGAVYDDGEVVTIDPGALPDAASVDNFKELSMDLVRTYSLDAKLTLDTLEALNVGDAYTTTLEADQVEMFDARIRLESIGILGHSTGGGGATRLAITDDRIKALFAFDAWVEPVEVAYLEQGITVPSVFFRSEQWANGPNNDALQIIVDQTSTVTDFYQINGIYHQDFTMMYMFKPLNRMIGFSGELEDKRSSEIQLDYVMKFFDYQLKGVENDLDQLVEDYDEVVSIF